MGILPISSIQIVDKLVAAPETMSDAVIRPLKLSEIILNEPDEVRLFPKGTALRPYPASQIANPTGLQCVEAASALRRYCRLAMLPKLKEAANFSWLLPMARET